MEAYNERRREAHEKVEKNANARKALVVKKIEGVKKLHDKYGHESTHLFAKFSKDECLTYLQYKSSQIKTQGCPRTCKNGVLVVWSG